MIKPISYENACNLKWTFLHIPIKDMTIYKEADEHGACELITDNDGSPPKIDILYRTDSLGERTIGFIIGIFSNDITVYAAQEINGMLRGTLTICTLDLDADLKTVINTALVKANICPVCNKVVPFNEQHLYSFAGKCCSDCLPKMKKKYEQPCWYN